MTIYTQTRGLDKTLFLTPDDEDEARVFSKFSRRGEPLVAVLKKDPSYSHVYIEIRKESNQCKELLKP